jgi:hypothetical protein
MIRLHPSCIKPWRLYLLASGRTCVQPCWRLSTTFRRLRMVFRLEIVCQPSAFQVVREQTVKLFLTQGLHRSHQAKHSATDTTSTPRLTPDSSESSLSSTCIHFDTPSSMPSGDHESLYDGDALEEQLKRISLCNTRNDDTGSSSSASNRFRPPPPILSSSSTTKSPRIDPPRGRRPGLPVVVPEHLARGRQRHNWQQMAIMLENFDDQIDESDLEYMGTDRGSGESPSSGQSHHEGDDDESFQEATPSVTIIGSRWRTILMLTSLAQTLDVRILP